MSGSDATTDEPVFGLWYDFRNPDPQRPFSRFYAEVLDQIAWAEGLGLGSVWLTEHHFCDDGYSPSPFVLAAAIGQRTTSMRIGTNLIVSPLHDPVRLAEDAATLSLLTGGRFDLGVGQGYWEREFAAFGKKVVNRPSLLEEGVAVTRERSSCGTPRPRSPSSRRCSAGARRSVTCTSGRSCREGASSPGPSASSTWPRR